MSIAFKKGDAKKETKRKLDFRMMTALNCNHFMDNHLWERDGAYVHVFKLHDSNATAVVAAVAVAAAAAIHFTR